MDYLANSSFQELLPSMYAVFVYVFLLVLMVFNEDNSDIKKLSKKYFFENILAIYLLDAFLYSLFLTPWHSTKAFFTEWPTVVAFFTEWPWFSAFFTEWPTINYLIDNYSSKLIFAAIVLTLYLIYLSKKLNSTNKSAKDKVKKKEENHEKS